MNRRKCEFYWPFLSAYDLEEMGYISDWTISGKVQVTIKLPPKRSYISEHKHTCRRIQAIVDPNSDFTRAVQSWEPCDFRWADDDPMIVNGFEMPKHRMAKTLIRSISRGKGTWVFRKSRFVLWNLSYVYMADTRLRMDLFPECIVMCYWPKDENGMPDYTLQYYSYVETASEIYRQALSFAKTAKELRKANLGESKPFYLSLVYPESRLLEISERIFIFQDTTFLHPNFFRWGRLTPDDDPAFLKSPDKYIVRKIRT